MYYLRIIAAWILFYLGICFVNIGSALGRFSGAAWYIAYNWCMIHSSKCQGEISSAYAPWRAPTDDDIL